MHLYVYIQMKKLILYTDSINTLFVDFSLGRIEKNIGLKIENCEEEKPDVITEEKRDCERPPRLNKLLFLSIGPRAMNRDVCVLEEVICFDKAQPLSAPRPRGPQKDGGSI